MPFESFGEVPYSPSVVNVAVCVAVCEIFSFKEWCDLENRVRVRSRSLKIALFDNNIIIIISKTMFMVLSSWQSHCKSSLGLFDECRTAPSGRRPKTKPDDLGYESACTGCQNLHPPSPFIIITQPESWYSFYRPTEGRRLSRHSWLVTYQDGLGYLSTDGNPSWY